MCSPWTTASTKAGTLPSKAVTTLMYLATPWHQANRPLTLRYVMMRPKRETESESARTCQRTRKKEIAQWSAWWDTDLSAGTQKERAQWQCAWRRETTGGIISESVPEQDNREQSRLIYYLVCCLIIVLIYILCLIYILSLQVKVTTYGLESRRVRENKGFGYKRDDMMWSIDVN
jgi:hypothetical protein